MYAYFEGTLAEKESDGVVLEINHIGYNIYMSPGVPQRLPEVGATVKIYTYTSVREDAFLLYGFLTKDDLKMFRLLITVSGIGPKGAMGILSVMDSDTLKMAIISQDAKMIAKAPGIGAKTVGRMILELKDKIKPQDLLTSPQMDSSENDDSQLRNEASEALVSLGYSVSDAYRVLHSIEFTEDKKIEDIIKEALKKMI